MATPGSARLPSSATFSPGDLPSPDLRLRIISELDRGFELVNQATLFRQSCRPSDAEQALRNAFGVCQFAGTLLAQLPHAPADGLKMRYDALHSIVFDMSDHAFEATG